MDRNLDNREENKESEVPFKKPKVPFKKPEEPFKKPEEPFKKPEGYKSLNSSSTIYKEEEENIFDLDASTVFYELLVSLKNLFVIND